MTGLSRGTERKGVGTRVGARSWLHSVPGFTLSGLAASCPFHEVVQPRSFFPRLAGTVSRTEKKINTAYFHPPKLRKAGIEISLWTATLVFMDMFEGGLSVLWICVGTNTKPKPRPNQTKHSKQMGGLRSPSCRKGYSRLHPHCSGISSVVLLGS